MNIKSNLDNTIDTSQVEWSLEQAKKSYRIEQWSEGYFSFNEKGQTIIIPDPDDSDIAVSLESIIEGIKARGIKLPCVLRIEDLIENQIKRFYRYFNQSITKLNYQGKFRGVYPIKVNQNQEVVEAVAKAGRAFGHGLEAGSKAELLAAIPIIGKGDMPLVCNGYKDSEFIELALFAKQLGINCILVVESPKELELILKISKELDIRPNLGVRAKLSTVAGGKWGMSSGDSSLFGLDNGQILALVESLRKHGYLDCLQLLHSHLGSQIPDIKDIELGVLEATRIYMGLVAENASMGYLDLGGGLGVDYEGLADSQPFSRNYSIKDYCDTLVKTIKNTLAENNIAEPDIVTESGRATVAYFTVLLTKVLYVAKADRSTSPQPLPQQLSPNLTALIDLFEKKQQNETQDEIQRAIDLKEKLYYQFIKGEIPLREWAITGDIYRHIMLYFAKSSKVNTSINDSFKSNFTDIYYCNFSIFKSLPDVWAINQVFPVLPIKRMHEKPERHAILADITCDSDGKVDQFIGVEGTTNHLMLHELEDDEDYILGFFLVGAYQETLGDFHNLLGDTSVVTIKITGQESFMITSEIEGDSISEVMSYVEYEPAQMKSKLRKLSEQAIQEGRITPAERKKMMDTFVRGLANYTYLK